MYVYILTPYMILLVSFGAQPVLLNKRFYGILLEKFFLLLTYACRNFCFETAFKSCMAFTVVTYKKFSCYVSILPYGTRASSRNQRFGSRFFSYLEVARNPSARRPSTLYVLFMAIPVIALFAWDTPVA